MSRSPLSGEVLNRLNDERKQTERSSWSRTSLKIAHQPEVLEKHVLVLDGNSGTMGFGHSSFRLSEMYKKPVILINWEDDSGRSSCRSVEGFDIYKALEACQQHLLRLGDILWPPTTIAKDQLSPFIIALQRWCTIGSAGQGNRSTSIWSLIPGRSMRAVA